MTGACIRHESAAVCQVRSGRLPDAFLLAATGWDERKSSLPGYFFGVYYEGSAAQCLADRPGCASAHGSSCFPVASCASFTSQLTSIDSRSGCNRMPPSGQEPLGSPPSMPCDVPVRGALHRCHVCVFPAAMVIVSGIFNVAFLITLWVVCSRVAASTVNRCDDAAAPVQACVPSSCSQSGSLWPGPCLNPSNSARTHCACVSSAAMEEASSPDISTLRLKELPFDIFEDKRCALQLAATCPSTGGCCGGCGR